MDGGSSAHVSPSPLQEGKLDMNGAVHIYIHRRSESVGTFTPMLAAAGCVCIHPEWGISQLSLCARWEQRR